ncbi:hypothetical protein AVEN_120992-1 [Araneus ventricosus]|uniref:Uncharacterized protein n=1 Tax=Araneus ventricosus TaxID=182803 RepID=A0A4Y2HFL0_ARAVE|nr:hypothetical protein AVEN_120992-1 [Araneus ventricosus]
MSEFLATKWMEAAITLQSFRSTPLACYSAEVNATWQRYKSSLIGLGGSTIAFPLGYGNCQAGPSSLFSETLKTLSLANDFVFFSRKVATIRSYR